MSTKSRTRNDVTCQLDGCDKTGNDWEFFNGEFCGSAHYYAAQGRGALNDLADDHRFCGTCFAAIRDVAMPSEEWIQDKASRVRVALDHGAEYVAGPGGEPVLDVTACDQDSRPVAADAVIGLQSATDQTILVTDEQAADDDRAWHRRRRGRWGCQCGNIDYREREPALQRAVGFPAVASQLLHALQIHYQDGQIPNRPSSDELIATLNEHGLDWGLAVGRCIYA